MNLYSGRVYTDDKADMEKKKKLNFFSIFFLIFIFLIFFKELVAFFINAQWFESLGFSSVFWFNFNSKFICGFSLLLIWLIFCSINTFIILKLKKFIPQVIVSGVIELPKISNLSLSFLYLILVILSVVFFIDGFYFYEIVLDFIYRTPFNQTDPVFSKDLSFYVFVLPFYEYCVSRIFWMFVSLLCLTAGFYIFARGFRYIPTNFNLPNLLKRHVLILLSVAIITFALRVFLFRYSCLLNDSGFLSGAFFIDVYARIPSATLFLLLSCFFAFFLFGDLKTNNYKRSLIGVGSLILFFAASFFIYPFILQRLTVIPNELSKEGVFISRNIDFTRKAFGLEKFKEQEYPADTKLTASDIADDTSTLENVRLWDPTPLLEAYSELQEIRTYYKFFDVDFDRYFIDGKYRQVMISPRELARDRIPDRKWINETFTYTHGYGCCLSPVNDATLDGLPNFFIKDIPPVSAVDLKLDNPAIYYGELTDSYCIVNSNEREFDYPMGDENVYCSYNGKGGVKISSFLNRLFFASYFGDIKLLLSSEITNKSKVLFNRKISEIVKNITPYVIYDKDPYIVISEGKFFWIIDGYTVSSNYPYSQNFFGINYIRNSVKAVINAYDGDVSFYISDESDPIIKTKSKTFKNLFKSFSELPEDLKSHMRYPEYLLKIQAKVYSRYHMTDPQIFYNQEDLWKIPSSISSGEIDPYYTILRLPKPNGVKEEFVLALPFSPARKSNMIALAVARCDAPFYGETIVYTFPKDKLIFGPSQIDSRIDQEPEIAKQLALWSRGGSNVIRGNLTVIPIDGSLIYIEPLFLAAEKGKIPQLKKIFVVYEDKVAMEDSLEQALKSVFGVSSDSITTDLDLTENEKVSLSVCKKLIIEASSHFDAAKKAQREDDWASYGREMKELEKKLYILKTGVLE